jgi:hypothetical protein
MYAGLRKGLVDSGLIGPERTATLQYQGHAFEGETPFCHQIMWLELNIHGMLSISDQCPTGTGPPSFTLRRVSASNAAAAENQSSSSPRSSTTSSAPRKVATSTKPTSSNPPPSRYNRLSSSFVALGSPLPAWI